MQEFKDSLKACFENVNIFSITYCHFCVVGSMSFVFVFSQPPGPLDDTSLTRSQFSLNLCQDPLHNEHTRHGRHRVHSSTQRHFIRHLKLKTKENNQTISNMILQVSLKRIYFFKSSYLHENFPLLSKNAFSSRRRIPLATLLYKQLIHLT